MHFSQLRSRRGLPRYTSLVQITVDPVSAAECIGAAAEAGFDAASIRLKALPGDPDPDGGKVPIDDIRRSARDGGIDILTAMGFWILAEHEADRLEYRLDAAAEIGARTVMAVVADPDESRAMDRFARLCASARNRQLPVALEFIPFITVKDIPTAMRFVDHAGLDSVGLAIDALHVTRSGGHPRDLAQVPIDRIRAVHLCDAPGVAPPFEDLNWEARHGRMLLGDGELPLREFLRHLPPDIPVELEIPSPVLNGLTPVQKARMVLERTRHFLNDHPGDTAG